MLVDIPDLSTVPWSGPYAYLPPHEPHKIFRVGYYHPTHHKRSRLSTTHATYASAKGSYERMVERYSTTGPNFAFWVERWNGEAWVPYDEQLWEAM